MARKKKAPSAKGPKKAPRHLLKRTGPPPEALPDLPDARALEAVLRAMLQDMQGDDDAEAPPDTPEGRAMEILDRAADADDPAQRARIAREALAAWPDCADAYLLLADDAPSRKERLALHEEAVAAGERAIGPEAFREGVGQFWLFLETRPYMRAREALAHTLWTLGRREEAAAHLEDLLRLNPNDNQGVRHTLAAWLLALDRDADLAALLDRYEEDSAAWAYNRVLLDFRQSGDTPQLRHRLKAARKLNKHVPAYLLGDSELPPSRPTFFHPGDRSEAILYAGENLPGWRSTPGALSWLQEATTSPAKRRKAQAAGPAPAGPSPIGKARLERLPQHADTWQADARPVRTLMIQEGRLVQPWMALAVSGTQGGVLGLSPSVAPPTPDTLWDLMAKAMSEPKVGTPHRPSAVHVPPGPPWDELRPHLEAIGVACRAADEPDALAPLFDDLARHLSADDPPGLLETPGVTPERVAGVFRAAAAFYRLAPWKRLGYEEAIRIAIEGDPAGPAYAVVMGQSGLTLGLALYDDLALLRRLWDDAGTDEENAEQTVALTITFEPETHVPTADVLAAREHGWDLAHAEAFPSIFRKERGLVMRPPEPDELERLEASLRAIPEFLDARRPGATAPHTTTVPVAAGERTVTLNWIDEA
jgi:tetratricopeptide (TPR) repeat protein